MKLFAACALGLEPVLHLEATALGMRSRAVKGGVELEGDVQVANLWLRTANRVLLRVAEIDQLEQLEDVDLRPFGALKTVEASTRELERAAQELWGVEPARGEVDADLWLRVEGDRCVVSVDSTGELLYFRGYRQEIGRAPMRETLAAGILKLASWDPSTPLWDVMCGSGTLVIEAALMATGKAPGALREFAFEKWPSHDAKKWKALSREKRPAVVPPIFGTDLNAGALGTTRRNAKRAGVLDALTLKRVDATKLAQRSVAAGMVVANLPYGHRVGERSELGNLYRGLGESLRRACPGWRFAFLLEEGEEHLGLKFDRTFPIKNGGISCRLVTGTIGS